MCQGLIRIYDASVSAHVGVMGLGRSVGFGQEVCGLLDVCDGICVMCVTSTCDVCDVICVMCVTSSV